MANPNPTAKTPAALSPLEDYRKQVLACLQANISTDALKGIGVGALGGALRGAAVGAEAGAPFDGVGALPGALAGGLAGGAIGAANGGLGALMLDAAGCAVLPNGAPIR